MNNQQTEHLNTQDIQLTKNKPLDQMVAEIIKYLKTQEDNSNHEKRQLQASFHIRNKLAFMASTLANPKTKAEKAFSDLILTSLISTFRWSIEFIYHKSEVDPTSFTEEDSLIWLLPHIRANIIGNDAVQVGLQELLKLQKIPKSSNPKIQAMFKTPTIDCNKIRKAINEEFGFNE